MNKQAISKTAVCYWSDEDNSYVVESPLLDPIAGVGETPEEAFRVFENLLADAYEAYLAGRVPGYDKPGRPAKGNVSLNTDLNPECKEQLRTLSNQFGCSMGEVIDFLLFYFEHVRSELVSSEAMPAAIREPKTTDDVRVLSLQGIESRLDELKKLVRQVHEDVHKKLNHKEETGTLASLST